VQGLPPEGAQMLGPPPPQNSGSTHVPQFSVWPPQPSLCTPHLLPWARLAALVFGTHVPPSAPCAVAEVHFAKTPLPPHC
jgi:hypothetical protein